MATPLDSPIRALPDNGPVDLDNDRMVIEQDETAQIPPRAFLQKAFDTLLSGFSPGANQPVQSGDSLFVALQKLQAQINNSNAANIATVETTDETWTEIKSLTVSEGDVLKLTVEIVAVCVGGQVLHIGDPETYTVHDGACIKMEQLFCNKYGGAQEQGEGVKHIYPDENETWDAAFIVNDDDVKIMVKGQPLAHLNWKVQWWETKI